MTEGTVKAQKEHKGINPIVLIVMLIFIAAILTYILPAGQFDRVRDSNTGKIAVVPGTYHQVDSNPASFGDFALSFDKGIKGAVDIISFLMLIGGAFGVVTSTGAIEALMARLIVRFKSESKKYILIAILLLFFAVCAGSFGMSLEAMVFVPFLIMLMTKMGYDALLGASIPVIGVEIGYGAAFLNPFSLGIAQGIAGLPYTSGIGVRLLLFIIFYLTATLFLIRYAKKVRKNPAASLCTSEVFFTDVEIKNPEDVVLTAGHKRVLVIFVFSILFLVFGTIKLNFYMAQCATVFLFMGILAGLAYKMKSGEIAMQFVEGIKNMIVPCLLVGFARAINIILENAMVMDTVVYYLSLPLTNAATVISAPLMVVVQTLVNFFINSGSGQAVVMMPLMTPIADLVGVNRQVAVLAFQIGDGLSNMFWITSPEVLIILSMIKMSYVKWVKYITKLFLTLVVIGTITVCIAQIVGWGPF